MGWYRFHSRYYILIDIDPLRFMSCHYSWSHMSELPVGLESLVGHSLRSTLESSLSRPHAFSNNLLVFVFTWKCFPFLHTRLVFFRKFGNSLNSMKRYAFGQTSWFTTMKSAILFPHWTFPLLWGWVFLGWSSIGDITSKHIFFVLALIYPSTTINNQNIPDFFFPIRWGY